MKEVIVIGGGLAGCEAAYQLAKRGIHVKLYEKKRIAPHPAFKSKDLAELICSNSLRSNSLENAVGLLKEEMRIFDSLIMQAADANALAAGTALACDREGFSSYVTKVISDHPDIEVIDEEVTTIDTTRPTIIAAGPLCEGGLAEAIKELSGQEYLYFFDAIAPIIEKDSIDFDHAYYKSRYQEGEGDYINCPLTKEEFDAFYEALIKAPCVEVKDVDKEVYFEGCMPFEVMAKRGKATLLYGPMKPVGLEHDGIRPYAVCQLRQDNAIKTLYNIVGFQTHLTYGAQKEVLQLIPALRKANIVRYGVMHRNTYINSPRTLNSHYQFIAHPNVFAVGQISGVEGYVESAASGLYGALAMCQYLAGQEIRELGPDTMMGAMARYISDPAIAKLVPMNANFGIFRSDLVVDKKHKRKAYSDLALSNVKRYKEELAWMDI